MRNSSCDYQDASSALRVQRVGYEHPDARILIGELQDEYVVRYGEQDITRVRPAEFSPPLGLFLLGYADGRAVASGGWRRHDVSGEGFQRDDAELKRMYVVPAARGRGFARFMLAALERSAKSAGCRRVVLETGTRQPEAIALYRAEGYHEIPKFGAYQDDELSRCFAKTL